MPTTESRPRGRDAPQTAARRLLASGEWVTAARYADLLGAGLTDGDARKCYLRLVRAGWEDLSDPTERIRLGRERLAQEALQRLVQRGELEAAGKGGQRSYRMIHPTGTGEVMFTRPKPRKEWLPVERLTFDARLQMRSLGAAAEDGALTNEQWVQYLLALRTDPDDRAEFDPIECVEEVRKNKEPLYWVFSGFHRGEVYRRLNEASVECLIYPGTFLDAQFYALGANPQRQLPREARDCRKAFETLIHTEELLARVLSAAKDDGGVHRAMALACGISKGAVHKYLNDAGLQVDRKSKALVGTPKPAVAPPEPEPNPPPAPEPEPTVRAQPVSPARARIADGADDPQTAAAKSSLEDVNKFLRAVGRQVESLLASKAGDALRRCAASAGLPFQVETREPKTVMPRDGDRNPLAMERVETWPALAALMGVFGAVGADLAAAEMHKGK